MTENQKRCKSELSRICFSRGWILMYWFHNSPHPQFTFVVNFCFVTSWNYSIFRALSITAFLFVHSYQILLPGVKIVCCSTKRTLIQWLLNRAPTIVNICETFLHFNHSSHSCTLYALKACCIISRQPSSHLLFFLQYFSYSLYFCLHLQPCLLLVPTSHRLPNLSDPLSRLCSASWPWTAPPWGENRCSGTHLNEHSATCGMHPRMSTKEHTGIYIRTQVFIGTKICSKVYLIYAKMHGNKAGCSQGRDINTCR